MLRKVGLRRMIGLGIYSCVKIKCIQVRRCDKPSSISLLRKFKEHVATFHAVFMPKLKTHPFFVLFLNKTGVLFLKRYLKIFKVIGLWRKNVFTGICFFGTYKEP